MAKEEKLKTPSVIAFERKIDLSDGLMYSGVWEERNESKDWKSIKLREKAVRGTISNRLSSKKEDPAKLDADIRKANLQRVDVGTLPVDSDTLKVHFTIKIIGHVGEPSACNDPEYRKKLKSVVDHYIKEFGFDELSHRYAQNLANGRFLWRNRLGAEELEVHVNQIKNGTIVNQFIFNSFKVSMRSFDVEKKVKEELSILATSIKQGFVGEDILILDVNAFARVGKGQEVYPSQELTLDKSKSKETKSKILYSVEGVAGIHSQKIGNAIRTIDTWYPDSDHEIGPIAIEPYGSVTSHGKAYRQPKEHADFYSLLDNWIINDEIPEPNNQHYVIANLIRGGVFGKSEKEDA